MSLSNHLKFLRDLDGMGCQVGFFDTAKYPDGTPVASVAHDNEYGVPPGGESNPAGCPPRPFMRFGMNVGMKGVGEVTQKLSIKAISGQLTPEQVMGSVGAHFEGCIVSVIKESNWVPNSEETIARKGFNKPLIDTGEMWQSVASRTTKRGE